MQYATPKQLLMVLVTALCLAASASAQEWSTFEPEGQGFAVSMPGTPQEYEDVKDARMWYSSKPNEYVYIVAFTDVGEIKPEQEEDLLNESATANLEGAEATESARRTINWQGWNAVECQAEKDGAPYFLRLLYVPEHQRMYFLTTIGPISDEDLDKFLESLEFASPE